MKRLSKNILINFIKCIRIFIKKVLGMENIVYVGIVNIIVIYTLF